MPPIDSTSLPGRSRESSSDRLDGAAKADALPGGWSWSDLDRAGWHWRIRRDWAGFFDSPEAPDWLNLRQHKNATLVKTNDNREIWQVHMPAGSLYAKIDRPGRRWSRLRRLLRGPDALREWRVADYAARCGIPAVAAVAAAWAPVDGRRPASILITSALPDARQLDRFWMGLDPRPPTARQIRNAVIDATAELIAGAHQNGFLHTDLHAGNILIQSMSDGTFRAAFVDLQPVRIGHPISDRRAIWNLAQFNQWFEVNGQLTDRIRFLKRYLQWRDRLQAKSPHGRKLDGDLRGLLTRLERAARSHANTLAAKRDRQAMRDGRYFGRITLDGGSRAHVFLSAKHPQAGSAASSMTFTREQWRRWLTPPLDWITPADLRSVIKDSETAFVCRGRLSLDDDRSLEAVCKRTSPRRVYKRLKYLFRRSREMRNWKRGNALLNRYIPTARPLAVCETRHCGLLRESLILSEYVENAHDLDSLLVLQSREMPPERQRWLKGRLIAGLVRIVHGLEEAGLVHRDLKASNILVQWDIRGTDEPRLLLVDLDGIRRQRWWRPRSPLMSIARLSASLEHCRSVSRTDRLRFLNSYLGRFGRPKPNWKTVWRRIDAKSQRRLYRKACENGPALENDLES